nr:MP [Passion fruit yellow mosaic virus]
MSDGLPTRSRRSQLDVAPRFISPPSARVGSRLPKALSDNIPLVGFSRPTSLSPKSRSPSFRSLHSPSSSSSAQNTGDQPPLQSLEFSRQREIFSGLHEAIKVRKAPKEEFKLPGALQLPRHSNRLRSVPFHNSHSALSPDSVHARRLDVHEPRADSPPLSSSSGSDEILLLPRRSTRESLHQPVSPPKPVPVSTGQRHPSLHSRAPPRRFLQPAHRSSKLVENQFHPAPKTPAICNDPGILGPPPLHSDSERSSSPSSDQFLTPPSSPPRPSPPRHSGPGLLPNPRLPRAPRGHLPPSTSPGPSRPNHRLQRPVHLHQGRPHSQDLRSRRVRQVPLQQTRALLGHTQCLGQSPDLRASELPNSPKRLLPLLPKPSGKSQTVLPAALEKNRRSRRSFPLLPNPPAALPPVVFASPKGKVHLRLPQTPQPSSPSSPSASESSAEDLAAISKRLSLHSTLPPETRALSSEVSTLFHVRPDLSISYSGPPRLLGAGTCFSRESSHGDCESPSPTRHLPSSSPPSPISSNLGSPGLYDDLHHYLFALPSASISPSRFTLSSPPPIPVNSEASLDPGSTHAPSFLAGASRRSTDLCSASRTRCRGSQRAQADFLESYLLRFYTIPPCPSPIKISPPRRQ